MANPVWPSGLPQCLQQSGFNQTLANNLSDPTKFDVGVPQLRRRSTMAPEKINGSILLDEDLGELTLFREFYDDTLFSGSSRFDWVDPPTKTLRVFQFTSQPSISNVGGSVYSVSLSLDMYKV